MDKQTDILRNKLHKHIENNGITWYSVAVENEIIPQTLYAFRDGGGINFPNALKLMKHLNIEIKDLK